jgi:hypothetical protein
MQRSPIKHCRDCGNPVRYRLPDDGDTRQRAICTACDTVHYENPLNVVGTVPYFGDRVLLCMRNIEPRLGKWTLPAGFMELGEMEGLFSVLSVPRVGQVHMFYRARLLHERFEPGPETQEARLFGEHEIPWDEIAFRTVRETLLRYFDDRRRGVYTVHTLDIE